MYVASDGSSTVGINAATDAADGCDFIGGSGAGSTG
jgi:hypothetical protein